MSLPPAVTDGAGQTRNSRLGNVSANNAWTLVAVARTHMNGMNLAGRRCGRTNHLNITPILVALTGPASYSRMTYNYIRGWFASRGNALPHHLSSANRGISSSKSYSMFHYNGRLDVSIHRELRAFTILCRHHLNKRTAGRASRRCRLAVFWLLQQLI